ncbi:phage tail protein I [Halodesulfovibrio aestuarii]|uniref:Phage tail protein I n=1 Tax=Halodesulfovibrio aestuarii TaxID=126333 RepID=A0ABV4JTX6_9BACT
MSSHLLPPSASPAERAFSEATSRLVNIPVPLRTLVSADDCPIALLPWLAWSLSVDEWEESWTEEQKRETVRQSNWIHRHKGTRGAVKRAVNALGYRVQVVEWWQAEPKGQPGTYSIEIEVDDRGVESSIYSSLMRLVDSAKNERSHLAGFCVVSGVHGVTKVAVATCCGAYCTVGPYVPSNVDAPVPYSVAARVAAYQTIIVRSL